MAKTKRVLILLTLLGNTADEMGITERKIRQKENVKASILSAAWALVEKEGWQNLSIRKIADAIEYSVPVIYDHYANKEAIMLEFTRLGFRLLNERLMAAKQQFADPGKQIEAIAYAYWKFAFENKAYYQLMYGLGMPSCEMVRQIPEITSFTMLVKEPFELMIKQSGSSADSFLKFSTFWSLLHGLISINMMGSRPAVDSPHADLSVMVLNDFLKSFIGSIAT